MNKLAVKVHIDRAEAIKAGSANYGDVLVDLDPAALSQEQREVLASVDERDGITNLAGNPYSRENGMPPRPRLSYPDPVAWIDWHIASRASAKEIAEAKLAKAQANGDRYVDWASTRPLDEWIQTKYGGEYGAVYPQSSDRTITAPPEYSRGDYPIEVIDSVKKRLARLFDEAREEAKRRNEQSRQRREAAKAEQDAAEQRKAEQIAVWVLDNMDENAQGRFRLGMLATSEVLESMRGMVFAELNELAEIGLLSEYQPIEIDDIAHEEGCSEYDEPSLVCDVSNATSLTAEQFDRMGLIIIHAPAGAKVDARVHQCFCESCEAELSRCSAVVTAAIGELTFSREYLIDGA